MSGKDAHEEANDSGVGGGDVLEDDHEANQNWLRVCESKSFVQRFGFRKIGKESEHQKYLDLVNEKSYHKH